MKTYSTRTNEMKKKGRSLFTVACIFLLLTHSLSHSQFSTQSLRHHHDTTVHTHFILPEYNNKKEWRKTRREREWVSEETNSFLNGIGCRNKFNTQEWDKNDNH